MKTCQPIRYMFSAVVSSRLVCRKLKLNEASSTQAYGDLNIFTTERQTQRFQNPLNRLLVLQLWTYKSGRASTHILMIDINIPQLLLFLVLGYLMSVHFSQLGAIRQGSSGKGFRFFLQLAQEATRTFQAKGSETVTQYIGRCSTSDTNHEKNTAYTPIRNLVYPESPIDISYDTLKKVLQHFEPINFVAAERARFNMLRRSQRKSILGAAALAEVVQQSAWTQHVVAPTRYRTGQRPSLLDLVITNERHFVDQTISNAPLGHTDHCVLTFDFICYWARNPEPQTWIRNFCRADFSGMRIFLEQGDTEDELAFRKMRNRCKSEIRQWNIRKQATILDLARKNRNVLFKCMRHRRRNNPSAFYLRDRNGEPTGDLIVVSVFYSEHYVGLYSAPASSSHPTLSRRNNERPLSDLVLTMEDTCQLLHKINPFRASRLDEVHPRILKETSLTLATQFYLVLRQSLDEGHLPSSWKKAIVTIVYKTLGQLWPGSSRSIGHTTCCASRNRPKKAFAVSRMIRRTFSRITRMDFQILYGAYVRPLLEYANQAVYSGHTKDVILIERVQRAATKMVAGERQLLNDKNKTGPGNLGESPDPVYQSVKLMTRIVLAGRKIVHICKPDETCKPPNSLRL
ncbi:hypothetical protein CLF_110053 [Clonorchis sinensis]|uniref:Endonuclease/exonuclease/phosphatase domain-containing protein n=1 Tax=Clonorchis sinensis TaxID=79923 RepID=G7YK60_CLOSI|nr:hypothetical protein CLF_110053 [Clonorchis sinensis]